MKFSELEQLMFSSGVTTLADIARNLNTTPQAVSNWKARDQVPHHIIAKLNQLPPTVNSQLSATQTPVTRYSTPSIFEDDTISLSDILLTMAEQLKVIVFTLFIFVFLSFTYVQFIKQPLFKSSATILIPESNPNNLGGLAGIASQFGVNIPNVTNQTDLASPSLLPELLRSRTFAEKLLDKKFYTEKYKKELPLLNILTHGDDPPNLSKDKLIFKATSELNGEYFDFKEDRINKISKIEITAFEPMFSKKLADFVLAELESLNREFKSLMVSEKTSFIDNRIKNVKKDLANSEQRLKNFHENNRQVNSPSLELQEDRLMRDLDVQKNIYLTLKQQLELAKIEEVQKISIIRVLDAPQLPLYPSNKNLKTTILLSSLLGLAIGLFFAFLRSSFNNPKFEDRKKIRRIKNFLFKKLKDLLYDKRVTVTVSLLLLFCMPFYLSHQSQNPVFFGMYSVKALLINTVYVLTFLFCLGFFLRSIRKKK